MDLTSMHETHPLTPVVLNLPGVRRPVTLTVAQAAVLAAEAAGQVADRMAAHRLAWAGAHAAAVTLADAAAQLEHGSVGTWWPRPWTANALPHVPGSVTARCDGTSVGVIVLDTDGRWALLRRRRPPVGWAPAAGHVDDHGTPAQAAADELAEELGIRVDPEALAPLSDQDGRDTWQLWGPCRRRHPVGGPGHLWRLFRVVVPAGTKLIPAADEAEDAVWLHPLDVQAAAEHAVSVAAGRPAPHDARVLEASWVLLLDALGVVAVTPEARAAVAASMLPGPYQDQA